MLILKISSAWQALSGGVWRGVALRGGAGRAAEELLIYLASPLSRGSSFVPPFTGLNMERGSEREEALSYSASKYSRGEVRSARR